MGLDRRKRPHVDAWALGMKSVPCNRRGCGRAPDGSRSPASQRGSGNRASIVAMFLSVFDIFKVGIGPSSSHTMGPMAAAGAFLELLAERVATDPPPDSWLRLRVSLHGSLAFTGRGHATDRAIVLGLLGHRAGDLDIDKAEADVAVLRQSRHLPPLSTHHARVRSASPHLSSIMAHRYRAIPTAWSSTQSMPRAWAI